MRMVMSLGCIKMKLTPAQSLNATTINGAYAMGESASYGSIATGKVANFYITRPLPSLDFYPYAYATRSSPTPSYAAHGYKKFHALDF